MMTIKHITHKLPLWGLGGFFTLLLASCIDVTEPTDRVTEEQMMQSESSVKALNIGIAASVMNYGSTYSHAAYPALMIWRDVHCAELPVYSTSYDYFANSTAYMGEGQLYYDWWYQYFNTIHNANNVIRIVDEETAGEETLRYLGNALGYRAWCYLEASQMWEYKRTGVAVLDQQADASGIWGLTVPIVTEKTTMDESRNNPRAPFYTMYRFINNDLKHAENLLKGYERSQVNEMNTAVVSALSARFWMMVGSRFEESADDLQAQMAHENDNDGFAPLGVSSAKECYQLAKQYAQQAIHNSGEPLTREAWMNATTGFNTANDAWIFGIEMVPDDNTGASWKNFVSFMCPDVSFGVASSTYEAMRLCDKALYGKISDSDWRKMTWISPDDQGQAPSASKYATNLSASDFALLPELCGLKFHPASGEMTDFKSGAAIDLPIIRVEEMYFILAEATARTTSVNDANEVLGDFINTYRYNDGSYHCMASSIDEFIDEMMTQKRIEFWGEGVVFWDYKRLRLPVTRKYEGSNHPSSYQYNSPAGVVARWMNYYIPSNEYQYNKALAEKKNPDPSHTSEMEY